MMSVSRLGLTRLLGESHATRTPLAVAAVTNGVISRE